MEALNIFTLEVQRGSFCQLAHAGEHSFQHGSQLQVFRKERKKEKQSLETLAQPKSHGCYLQKYLHLTDTGHEEYDVLN